MTALATHSLDARSRRLFEDGVREYYPMVLNLVSRQIANKEEAQDVTQETFAQASRYIDRFRWDCKLSTWFCGIAINLCKNRYRRYEIVNEVEGPSLDATWVDASGDTVPHIEIEAQHTNPEEIFLNDELRIVLLNSIEQLSPQYREFIILRDLKHLSYEEIAQLTGLTMAGVKTRIHRGRLTLRRKLEPYLTA